MKKLASHQILLILSLVVGGVGYLSFLPRAYSDKNPQREFEDLLSLSCEKADELYKSFAPAAKDSAVKFILVLLDDQRFRAIQTGGELPGLGKDLRSAAPLIPVDLVPAFSPQKEIARRSCGLRLFKENPEQARDALPELVKIAGAQRLTLLDAKLESELTEVLLIGAEKLREAETTLRDGLLAKIIQRIGEEGDFPARLVIREVGIEAVPALLSSLKSASVASREKILNLVTELDSSGKVFKADAIAFLKEGSASARRIGLTLIRASSEVTSEELFYALSSLQHSSPDVVSEAKEVVRGWIQSKRILILSSSVEGSRAGDILVTRFLQAAPLERELYEGALTAFGGKLPGVYEALRVGLSESDTYKKALVGLSLVFPERGEIFQEVASAIRGDDIPLRSEALRVLPQFFTKRRETIALLSKVFSRECTKDRLAVSGTALAVDAAPAIVALRPEDLASSFGPCLWDTLVVLQTLDKSSVSQPTISGKEGVARGGADVRAALLALGNGVTPLLEKHLFDRAPLERALAVSLLAERSVVSKALVASFIKLLNDPDKNVRVATMSALRKHGFQAIPLITSLAEGNGESALPALRVLLLIAPRRDETGVALGKVLDGNPCAVWRSLGEDSELFQPPSSRIAQRHLLECMLGKDPFDPVLFGLLLSRLGTISSEDMPLFEQVMGSGKIPLGVQSALLQKWNELGLSEKFTLTTALSVITKDDTSAKIGAFKALFLLKDRRRDAFDAVLDLEKNNQIEKQLISWVRAFGALFQEGEASFLSFFTPLIKDGEGGEVREPLALIPKDIAMKAIRGALASGSEDGILNGLRLIRELPYQSLSPSDEFNALSGDLRAKVRVETLRTLLALAPDYPLTKQLLRSVVLSKLGDKLKGSELTEKGRSVIASLVESDPQNAIRVTARAILSR